MRQHVKRAALVVLVVGFAGTAAADDHKCQAQVEDELADHGLSMSDLEDAEWGDERMADADEQIVGYDFYALPPGCTSGALVVEMWPDCRIQHIHTIDGCQVKGIVWF